MLFGRTSEKADSWGDIWCEQGQGSAVVNLLTVFSQAVWTLVGTLRADSWWASMVSMGLAPLWLNLADWYHDALWVCCRIICTARYHAALWAFVALLV